MMNREKPLRFVHPDCYGMLTEQMSARNLHPYDIKADASWAEQGLTIILTYGEGLGRRAVRSFSRDACERLDDELALFFREAVEDCQKALIQDYFKMMKP